MKDDIATRRHTRAVAFVRWRIAAEKFEALGRACADRVPLEHELSRAGEEVSRRYAEWMSVLPPDSTGAPAPDAR
ncbi:MAG TPA: hypothetical protein VHM00_02680 [Caldimonas sp.]|jgi:hypothetical protein|nr:hypothetical protein [Caldimonas sp.]HEX2539967.1 hypothetical protein [Caldimonas sp.]